MGDRRCCCENCFSFDDTFTRDDSTNVGGNWNEVTGDWGILTNQLVEKYGTSIGTSGALVICKRAVSSTSGGEMFITVKVPLSDLGISRTYFIYPACVDENTVGPYTVSFYFDVLTSKWTIAIIRLSDSVVLDSYDANIIPGANEFVLTACCDYEVQMIKGYVGNTINPYAAWANVNPGLGRYAGIGHDNTAAISHFDDFSLDEVRIPTELCVPCFCQCGNTATQPTMTATIVLGTNRAVCLNGLSWNMDFYEGPQVVTWRGGLTTSGETINFELACGSGNQSNFTLRILSPYNCFTADGSEPAVSVFGAEEESTCEPLYLLFGPFNLSFTFHCSLCYAFMAPGECVMPSPPFDHTYCTGEFYIAITL